MATLDKNELYEIAEKIKDRIGIETFLNDILLAMSDKELFEMLEYIDRCEDLNLFNNDEENEGN